MSIDQAQPVSNEEFWKLAQKWNDKDKAQFDEHFNRYLETVMSDQPAKSQGAFLRPLSATEHFAVGLQASRPARGEAEGRSA